MIGNALPASLGGSHTHIKRKTGILGNQEMNTNLQRYLSVEPADAPTNLGNLASGNRGDKK
jgi:hypothetical protein